MSNENLLSISDLADSVRKAFQILEPYAWCVAKESTPMSDHPAIILIAKLIKQQAVAYFNAIDLSHDFCEHAGHFSGNAEDLHYMLNQGYPEYDLVKYVDRMIMKARQAHKSAKEMMGAFNKVSKGVSKLKDDKLPRQEKRVKNQLQNAPVSKKRFERGAECAKRVIDFLPSSETIIKDSITSSFTAPIFVIPLAIAGSLLLVKELAKLVEVKCKLKAEKRENQEKTLPEILRELNDIAVRLKDLKGHVDHFVTWWDDTCLKLKEVKELIKNDGGTDKEKLTSTLRKWSQVGDSLEEYARQIRVLRLVRRVTTGHE